MHLNLQKEFDNYIIKPLLIKKTRKKCLKIFMQDDWSKNFGEASRIQQRKSHGSDDANYTSQIY